MLWTFSHSLTWEPEWTSNLILFVEKNRFPPFTVENAEYKVFIHIGLWGPMFGHYMSRAQLYLKNCANLKCGRRFIISARVPWWASYS